MVLSAGEGRRRGSRTEGDREKVFIGMCIHPEICKKAYGINCREKEAI